MDLFTIVLRNDDIQEFDSQWEGILLFLTKISPDDILEGLYKSRIRESEKLKTVARRMGPQGMRATGGGGLARVPNLRVCYHVQRRVAHARGGRMN